MNCYIFILSSILFYAVSALSIENSLEENLMYILIGEEIFPISLIESQTTKELISILPLKTRLIQKDSTKIQMPLSAQIDTTILTNKINSKIEGNRGDIILYKGNEINILNEPTTLNNENGDYIKIGICENTEELLNKIGKKKTILLWNTLNYENHKGKVKPYGNYYSIMNYFTWKIFTFFCFLLI